ncbi:glucose-6-phosphate isomerase family protein [Brevibacillus thermoruber]|jgi:glucose-6-phosphate isomerase, archaeal|uniref:glucose-6-phosphate isomerase family protein n=1 Tax=Brevibacillus thermoruber TaxID=33942 RepID=UPI0003FF81BB|nr:glucose-6-phosphate isomerase family protein [Brevibacillus thermoruber]
MNQVQLPFSTVITAEELKGFTHYEERKLSDMKGYFADEEARAAMEQSADQVVYQVYRVEVPPEEGELLHCLTVIQPGQVAGECFMTKGHYHLNEKCAEIYVGVKGKGVLLMQKGQEVRTIEMRENTAAYIPAGWGHRTINVSADQPFVFFSVWPGHSGYDYQRAVEEPFVKRVYLRPDGYEVK